MFCLGDMYVQNTITVSLWPNPSLFKDPGMKYSISERYRVTEGKRERARESQRDRERE